MKSDNVTTDAPSCGNLVSKVIQDGTILSPSTTNCHLTLATILPLAWQLFRWWLVWQKFCCEDFTKAGAFDGDGTWY
ncbi:MAG: hypothetical protein IPP49_07145 [Saprospiraceae bacterium]|nr:hypothetical protein [Saprospiraceae bacterium]